MTHEAANLLAKGDAKPPATPAADRLDWFYTGNAFTRQTNVSIA
jgi:hypothetical protein